jgi:hypothetical protein
MSKLSEALTGSAAWMLAKNAAGEFVACYGVERPDGGLVYYNSKAESLRDAIAKAKAKADKERKYLVRHDGPVSEVQFIDADVCEIPEPERAIQAEIDTAKERLVQAALDWDDAASDAQIDQSIEEVFAAIANYKKSIANSVGILTSRRVMETL